MLFRSAILEELTGQRKEEAEDDDLDWDEEVLGFDISVDQFIHADGGAQTSSCRKHIDVLLNSMNEKELVVIEATAEGIKKARETEVPE